MVGTQAGSEPTATPTGPRLQRVPILMYHSISDRSTERFRPFTVSPAAFRDQIAYLEAEHYQPITVTELAGVIRGSTADLPPRPVVLTFDDGYADFYTQAWPVLQEHGFTATLYVCTEFIGMTSRWLQREGEGDRPMLSWEQLGKIAASGIECGSHSRTHPALDSLPAAAARREIVGSRRRLAEQLGCPILSFAYPFGYHDEAVRRMVQRAGYTSACAVRYAASSTRDDPFALARLMIGHETGAAAFTGLLEGGSSSQVRFQQTRALIWRLVRHSLHRGHGLLRKKAVG